MSEAVFFIVIFICILIIPACIRARQRDLQRRSETQDAALPAFRQQQLAQRRQQQQQGGSTAVPTATAPTTPTPQPTAPEEAQVRRQEVMKHLYHRTLEHGESVRTLSMVLKAANDRYQDTSTNDGGVLSRSWRSATSSVSKFVSPPECSICLDTYKAKETVCWAKNDDCDHIFHEGCIVAWLADHDECPLCRTNLLEYNHDEGEA